MLFFSGVVLKKPVDNSDRKKSVRDCNLSVGEPMLGMVEIFFYIQLFKI